jgi:hypothetical protein
MEQLTRFIGMDVHKDTIVVAVTTAGDGGKPRRMAHSPTPFRRWRNWLSACGKPAAAH